MRTLTYWVAIHKKSPARNIRGRFKRDVFQEIKNSNLNPYLYYEPRKVEIEYEDNFDLMVKVIRDLSWHEANLTKKKLRTMKTNNSYVGTPENRVDNNAFRPLVIRALKQQHNATSQQIWQHVTNISNRTIHHHDLLGVLHYMESKREIARTGKNYYLTDNMIK